LKHEFRNTKYEIRDTKYEMRNMKCETLLAVSGELRAVSIIKYEIRDQKYEMFYYALRGSEDRCGVCALMRVGVVTPHRIIASSLQASTSPFDELRTCLYELSTL